MRRIRGQSRNRDLSSSFDSFLLSNGKRLSIKVFLEVTFISLTLREGTVFFNFLKKRSQFACTAFLATQQQTITTRLQKFDSFYPNFSSKFNKVKVSLMFQKQQEGAKNWLKLTHSSNHIYVAFGV